MKPSRSGNFARIAHLYLYRFSDENLCVQTPRGLTPHWLGLAVALTSPDEAGSSGLGIRAVFRNSNEVANAPQCPAHRHFVLLGAEQIKAFRADERAADQRSDVLGRERAEAAKLPLRPARDFDEEGEPAEQAGADDVPHRRVGPACRDQLLQDADIA